MNNLLIIAVVVVLLLIAPQCEGFARTPRCPSFEGFHEEAPQHDIFHPMYTPDYIYPEMKYIR